jgi:hypothetical protein
MTHENSLKLTIAKEIMPSPNSEYPCVVFKGRKTFSFNTDSELVKKYFDDLKQQGCEYFPLFLSVSFLVISSPRSCLNGSNSLKKAFILKTETIWHELKSDYWSYDFQCGFDYDSITDYISEPFEFGPKDIFSWGYIDSSFKLEE